jgi:phosphoribosylamine--glycine ligase
MKILVLGTDGRAHALVWKIFNSTSAMHVLCAPSNGGIQQISPQVELDLINVAEIVHWSFEEGVDLVVPACEEPLRAGLLDESVSLHVDVCGPPQQSMQLGQSRCYAKELLLHHNLPTAPGRTFTNLTQAERYLAAQQLPIVLKADHRAIESGIYHDRYAALKALKELFGSRPLEGHNKGVVIEAFLHGPRVSISALTDGTTIVPLLPARVYDRLHEGDNGPLAPAIGAHTSTSAYVHKLTDYLHQRLLTPILAAMNQEQIPYRGVLGLDCIITAQGPRINSLRCSMRDMEAQVVLPRLEDDLVPLLQAVINGRLSQFPPLTWRDEASVGIALVAQGYPHHFPTGSPIEGLTDIDSGVLVFHHETYNPVGMRYSPSMERGTDPLSALIMGGGGGQPSTLTTTGGHVVTVVALAGTLNGARGRAILNAERINFAGRYFRGDIGQKDFI